MLSGKTTLKDLIPGLSRLDKSQDLLDSSPQISPRLPPAYVGENSLPRSEIFLDFLDEKLGVEEAAEKSESLSCMTMASCLFPESV